MREKTEFDDLNSRLKNSEKQYFYTTSLRYKTITFSCGLLCWMAFNLLTGLITDDHTLNDNYFVFLIILSYITFLNSYKIRFDRGHILTYQLGMITNNIDLYMSNKVINYDKRLIIYYPDDSRFPVKINRFNKIEQEIIKQTVQPYTGTRTAFLPDDKDIFKASNSKQTKLGHIRSIVGGIIMLTLGVIGYFTNIIFLPGRSGFIRLHNFPTEFYMYLTFFFLIGSISLTYGIICRHRPTDN